MDIVPRCRSGSEALCLGSAMYPTPCAKPLSAKRMMTPRVAAELEQVITSVATKVGHVILKSGLPPDAAIALMLSLACSWADEQELPKSAALAIFANRCTSDEPDPAVMLDLVRRLRKRARKLQL